MDCKSPSKIGTCKSRKNRINEKTNGGEVETLTYRRKSTNKRRWNDGIRKITIWQHLQLAKTSR